MNWFTTDIISGQSAEYKQARLDEDGGCEHVENDINLATTLRREKDSFGTVGSYVCCDACNKLAEEAEDNQEETCHDCHQTFKRKDGISWKWYDFYAPQGDEPLEICNACRVLPKHQDRVARDKADYEAEFGNHEEESEVDRSHDDDDDDCGSELSSPNEETEDPPRGYVFVCHMCGDQVEQETILFDHQHNMQCDACNNKMNGK